MRSLPEQRKMNPRRTVMEARALRKGDFSLKFYCENVNFHLNFTIEKFCLKSAAWKLK